MTFNISISHRHPPLMLQPATDWPLLFSVWLITQQKLKVLVSTFVMAIGHCITNIIRKFLQHRHLCCWTSHYYYTISNLGHEILRGHGISLLCHEFIWWKELSNNHNRFIIAKILPGRSTTKCACTKTMKKQQDRSNLQWHMTS